MKYAKLITVIIISFALGIIVSQTIIKREKTLTHSEKEENCLECEDKIKLSLASQKAIGIETIAAKRSHFVEKIPVTGKISQDAEEIVHIVPPETGVIVECKVKMGDLVKKDDTLCVIKHNGSETLIEVKTPIAGVVISDFAKEGEKADAASALHTVANLTTLLAAFDVYEKDISQILLGQKIIIRSVAYPQEAFEGEVTFISPRVDEDTHTIKIRAAVKNPHNLLKFGMFVNAEIMAESSEEFIILPQDAVHHLSGKRIVFVKAGDNDFQVREVVVTKESKESVAIEDGIKEGEIVVTKDGFLLKSELLKAKMGEGCAE
ncbi:MAG: efflux RND transporter periplasmic adaptor subunit [Candidatus Omnitrophota bacterium]|nr:efflux RND transporter periplasmic adaptor subunit [Candidatus Omnitrophota bacterium]